MWHEAQVPQIVGSLHPRTEQWGKMLCCVEHARSNVLFNNTAFALYLSTPIKYLRERAKGGERGWRSPAWNVRDCPSAQQDAAAMHYRYGDPPPRYRRHLASLIDYALALHARAPS